MRAANTRVIDVTRRHTAIRVERTVRTRMQQVGGRADAARELVGVLAAAPGGSTDPHVALLSAAVSLSQGKVGTRVCARALLRAWPCGPVTCGAHRLGYCVSCRV